MKNELSFSARSQSKIYVLSRGEWSVFIHAPGKEVNNGAFFMIDLPIIRSFWEGETIHYDQDHLTKQFGEIELISILT